MEITKQHADQLIEQAKELLLKAHQGYYKNCETNEDAIVDEAIWEALETLNLDGMK